MKANAKPTALVLPLIFFSCLMGPAGAAAMGVVGRPGAVPAAATTRSSSPPQTAWCEGMTWNGVRYPSYEARDRAIAASRRAATRSGGTSRGVSAQVKSDQQALQALGYYRGAIDGRTGPATISAVSQFRAANDLGSGTTLNETSRRVLMSGKAVAKTSSTVREDQQALADLGFYKGPVDGISGPATRSAVLEFKKEYDLDTSTAALDAESRARLQDAQAALASR